MWLLSLLLLCFSIRKYRSFGLVESFVVLSWFYIFVRPLSTKTCDFSVIYLYFWDENLYVNGVLLVSLLLILFQFGANLFPSGRIAPTIESGDVFPDFAKMDRLLNYLVILTVGVGLVMFVEIGPNLLPTSRGTGALSISEPALQKYFYIARVLATITVPLSLFCYSERRRLKYLLIFITQIILLLVFEKRGALVTPLIIFILIYTRYHFYLKRSGFKDLINIKVVFVIVFISMILFFGKDALSLREAGYKTVEQESLICSLISRGQQEFDVFNPAVIREANDKLHILDLPFALIGNFIPHEVRLRSDYSSFQSATDKLMLIYNREAYVNNKFGISPNIFQYFYFYFNVLSIVIIGLFAFLLRLAESKVFISFYRSKYLRFLVYYFVFSFLLSPHDFTLKYHMAFVFISFSLICGYELFKKLEVPHLSI